MCGHDLRIQAKRPQRISWVDALLVLAVLAVLGFWWQIGNQPLQEEETPEVAAILPDEIPILLATNTLTPTDTPAPTSTPIPPEDVLITHQVRSGETLLTIAGEYGITVEQIRTANNLNNDLIRIDQELLIPVKRAVAEQRALDPVESTFTYTVLDGDTVISIATTFGADPNAILAQNGLAANDIIRPGDTLIIPVGNVPGEVLQATPDPTNATSNNDISSSLEDENRIYLAPSLTGPPDNAVLAREDAVLLRWVSVDVLATNEWYVVQIYTTPDSTDSVAAESLPTIWTKSTSYRLDTAYAPQSGQSLMYTWRVSVIRVRTGVDGQRQLEPISPPSAPRVFTWQ